jgi:hypothetical protein
VCSKTAIGTDAELFNISGKQQWGLNRAFFNKINSEIRRAVWHIPTDTRHLYLYKIKGAFIQSNFLFQHQRDASKGCLNEAPQQMQTVQSFFMERWFAQPGIVSAAFTTRTCRELFLRSQDYGKGEIIGYGSSR